MTGGLRNFPLSACDPLVFMFDFYLLISKKGSI